MSITQKTRDYINQHLSIKDCLKKGVINYSALSRQIAKKIGAEKHIDAVLVASRRYVGQIVFADQEKDILALLKISKLKVRTGLCRFVLPAHTHLSDNIMPVHFIQGDSALTIVADEENYNELEVAYREALLDKRLGLAEVIVTSRKTADKTPGLTAYLSSLLAEESINVLTVLGSYQDDIFIIDAKDVGKALELFERLRK